MQKMYSKDTRFNKDKILEIIENSKEPLTVFDIAEMFEFDENNVRVYINRLIELGKVVNVGKQGKRKLYSKNNNSNNSQYQDLAFKLFRLMAIAQVDNESLGITFDEKETELLNQFLNKMQGDQ